MLYGQDFKAQEKETNIYAVICRSPPPQDRIFLCLCGWILDAGQNMWVLVSMLMFRFEAKATKMIVL